MEKTRLLGRAFALVGIIATCGAVFSCGNAAQPDGAAEGKTASTAQAATAPPPPQTTSCGSSSQGEPCTITKQNNSDGSVDYTINQPVVSQASQEFLDVTFQPGDEVSIDAGGCVQTGGFHLTWKNYVSPSGDDSDHLYFGLITIPGVNFNVPISSVNQKTVSIPKLPGLPQVPAKTGCVYPTSAHLVLGYPDDEYDDNGYYSHDDGDNDQCKGIGSAFVHLHVVHGIPGPWPAGADFDLVPSCLDDNFIFQNPRWGYQVPGKTPIYDRNEIASEVSQSTSYDRAPKTSDDFLNFRFFKPIGCAALSGHLGHRNWTEVTYTGTIKWGDHDGGTFGDDDYNFDFFPPDPGVGTIGSNGAVIVSGGLYDRADALKLEFDSDETIDEFGQDDANDVETHWWWKKFHHAVDHDDSQAAAYINEHEAIVMGLMGIDEAHDDGRKGEEVHPVHVLAIRTLPVFLGDFDPKLLQDHWSILVRNWGDEGYCSHEDHYLDLSKIVLALPPSDPSVIDPTQQGFLAGSNVRTNRDDSSFSVLPVKDGSRPDMLCTFNMAQPPDHPWIAGELDVSWKRKTPLPSPTPRPLAAAAPVVAAKVVASPDDENDEEDLPSVLKVMTPEQRADFFSLVGQALPPTPVIHPFTLTPQIVTEPPSPPTSVPTVSVGPVRDRKVERFNVRIQALCAATQGSVPDHPGACDDVTPLTVLSTTGGSLSASNWIITPLTVTLTARDTSGKGVDHTEYGFDGNTWNTYSAPFIAPEGAFTIFFRSIDRAGKSETAHQRSFRIDTRPPTASGSVSTQTGVTLSYAVADPVPGSGPLGLHVQYQGSSASQTEFLASPTGVVPLPTACSALEIWGEDIAGNLSSHVQIADTVPPTFTSLKNNGVLHACSADPTTIGLGRPQVSDACPGGVSVSGQVIARGTTSLVVPVNLQDNGQVTLVPGTFTVRWTATDSSGNSATRDESVSVVVQEDASCCPAGGTLIAGTEGSDVITPAGGSSFNVLALGGADLVVVGGGNDCVVGGPGSDNIFTGAGNDIIFGGDDSDNISNSTGHLEVHGGAGGDNISAALCSSAAIFGGSGDDNLAGSPGADTITPGPGRDLVSAGAGNDTIVLFNACEAVSGKVLDGGPGTDTLISPLSRAQLLAAGVTLTSIENVVVNASQSYLSECFR